MCMFSCRLRQLFATQQQKEQPKDYTNAEGAAAGVGAGAGAGAAALAVWQ